MRKFIVKILKFGLLLFVVAAVADYVLSKQYHQTADYRYAVWNDIVKGGMQNDLIVMGSSRSWVHISPKILDSALNISSYNIGMDGSCIDRQIPRYKMYRKRNAKPKVIIQNVDWNSTLQNGERDKYLMSQYYPYFFDADMRKIAIGPEEFGFFEMWVPLFRYLNHSNLGRTIRDIRGLSNAEFSVEKGYRGFDQSWDGLALKKIDSIYFKYNQSSLIEFCDYLADCQKDSVKVVFVYAPFYVGGRKKVVNLQEFYSLFESVAREYNVTILDYLENDICTDTAFFYNAMHLNRRGAEKFTRMLARDLDSILIQPVVSNQTNPN